MVTLSGCETRRVEHCFDSFAGVWTADDGRAYHIVERGSRITIFPMHDSAASVGAKGRGGVHASAAVYELNRMDSRIDGHMTQWLQRGDARCRQQVPVRVSSCSPLEIQHERAPTCLSGATYTAPTDLSLQIVF